MDSLGEFLKEARLKSNISIEQVVEDTHIVKKFIEAIERDEFSAFPGEAYLKGFLRTYSQYLGLDSDDVIKKYEKIKMMETPTPIEQLIPKPQIDFKPLVILLVIVIFLSLIGMGGYFIVKNISSKKNIVSENNTKKETQKNKLTSQTKDNIFSINSDEEKKIEKLKKGDIIEIGNEKYRIVVKELYPIVTLTYGNNKELILIQSYQHKVDLNEDGDTDVLITLNNWDNNFANISFKLNQKTNLSFDSKEIGENPEVVFTTPSLEGININLSIKKDTYLRHKIDDLEEIEKYYATGAFINLKIKNKAIVWLTNGSAASLLINNKEIPLGQSGAVEVKLISWQKNSNSEYEIILSSLK